MTDGDYVEPTAGMRPTIIVSNTTLKVDDKVYSFDDKGISTEVTPKNQFIRDDFWNWYYYDKDGKLLTGRQTIDGVQLYFDKNGKQVKGSLVEIDGKTYYFDKASQFNLIDGSRNYVFGINVVNMHNNQYGEATLFKYIVHPSLHTVYRFAPDGQLYQINPGTNEIQHVQSCLERSIWHRVCIP